MCEYCEKEKRIEEMRMIIFTLISTEDFLE